MLLLDQGLPRSSTTHLEKLGIAARHASDLGLSTASDEAILAYALRQKMMIVTLDADFHRQLALSGARGPSVIRVRMEGLKSREIASLLARVLEQCGSSLESGAMVTVTESNLRVRNLPLVESQNS